MSYYPLSQIKPNLHTNGGEFVILSTKENYTGYYFKTSTGEYFTGRNQNDLPNQPLTLSTSPLSAPTPFAGNVTVENVNIFNTEYDILKNTDINQVTFIPTYAPTIPTQQDYQIGEFRRFFCKKTNEIQYVEINVNQYSLLAKKDPQILWQLYLPFNIPWVISGNAENAASTNKNIIELTMKQLKLPRLNDYLKNDYLKYFV
jgi:hypothetical protein